MSAKMHLHIYICPTEYLDESSIVEQYKFLKKFWDFSVNIQGFHKILLVYSHAVLYRERRDGSLRGISLMKLERIIVNSSQLYTLG